MVRGKLAQEDVIDIFGEGGLYTKYLIGEIHADFLDLDNEEDSATSSRQRIIEDDPRYVDLKSYLGEELKYIQSVWTGHRNEQGVDKAEEIPEVREWLDTPGTDHRKKAASKSNPSCAARRWYLYVWWLDDRVPP